VTSTDDPLPPWAADEAAVFAQCDSRPTGITSREADARRSTDDQVHTPRRMSERRLILRQLENPIVLLLLGATALSIALGDSTDGAIILLITVASGTLGYFQERGAVRVVEELMSAVRVHSDVLRDGVEVEVPVDDVVVGDVLVLRAGDVIAGDARVLRSDSLLLDESALTGESFPIEKRPAILPAGTALGGRTNSVWCATHVVSGTGTAVVTAVGAGTEFGRVGTRLAQAHVPTAFELGLRRFGLMLMRTAGVLVAALFVVNVLLHRAIIESLLFSLALAVGLTPQLLPTIVSVTLSYGARQMAHRQVIVKRLDAIEDIGSIDVLCTDKTGTLTDGVVHFERALDPHGVASDEVAHLAWCNAVSQRGFVNPIDAAIVASGAADAVPPPVIDELPYDFNRRMLSVLVELEGRATVITKGAFEPVLAACALTEAERSELTARFEQLSADGFRVLGLAVKALAGPPSELRPTDETELTFTGFLCCSDPPKADAGDAIRELRELGVVTKLITGDNRYAAAHVATAVGIEVGALLTGAEMATLTEAQLDVRVQQTSVFAEIDPLHKEAIVAALRRGGRTVGYLGDGINDAPSLRNADVGISVDTAVDVAKHSASVVLLDKDLAVLAEGIRQGRRVFANTLKYVQVTMSANFGNMVSMAFAAAVLPFLPLLPRQILLLNFLSDIPGTTIAADRVDPEAVADPHGWDLRTLRTFMITFGLISSVFDLTTFAVLRLGFHAEADLFRTGWFIESTATELAVMLVLRTRRRAWHSRPGTALLATSIAIAAVTVALPFSPFADDLGLTRPGWGVLLALAVITLAYVATTEIAKDIANRHRGGAGPDRTLPRAEPAAAAG
jgi:Mg2+-importing ATPase